MRRLFQDTTARLQELVAQRDTLLLVVQCRDEETAYVTKTIDAIDEASQDVFFGYGDIFTEPAAYADAIVATFQKQAELLGAKLAEAGNAPWPPLPAGVLDRAEPFVRNAFQELRQECIEKAGLACPGSADGDDVVPPANAAINNLQLPRRRYEIL